MNLDKHIHFLKIKSIVIILVWFQSFCLAQNKSIDSLLTVLKTHKEDTNKVKTLKNLCWRYCDEGEYQKALFYGKQGIALGQKLNFKRGLSACFFEIAYVYKRQCDYPKALEYFNKSLKLDEEQKDKIGMSMCYNMTGVVFEEQGIFDKALEYYIKAKEIHEELNNKKGISIGYTNIGCFYYNRKNYPKALEFFTKSLKIDEELKDKDGIAVNYDNIGTIYVDQNNYPKAIEFLSKSIKLKEETGNKRGIPITLFQFSYMNNMLKNYSQARQQALRAISISNEIGDTKNLPKAYGELAKAEEGLGNYKAAYLYHKKFKELTDSIFNIENLKQMSEIKTKYEVDKKITEVNAANKIEQAKKDLQITKQKQQRNILIISFLIVLLLAIFIFRGYRQKQRSNIIITKQKEEVEQQKNIVEYQNKEILSSLEYAKRIQATILPSPRFVKKYFQDSFVLYLPKDIVAGDFYWMETLPSGQGKVEAKANSSIQKTEKEENKLIMLAACDCTGHGVPGALVSVVCSNALNRAVKEYNIAQPSLILDKVAELVAKDFSKDENENVQDGMDASVCCFNPETGKLQWAGANNPLWMVRNQNLIEIKANKQPIGKTDNLQPFTHHEISLEKGDTIYLFTDGYSDQFGGEKEKKFSKKSLKELILSINHISMAEQRESLIKVYEKWRGNNEQVDDICIIGVRI